MLHTIQMLVTTQVYRWSPYREIEIQDSMLLHSGLGGDCKALEVLSMEKL